MNCIGLIKADGDGVGTVAKLLNFKNYVEPETVFSLITSGIITSFLFEKLFSGSCEI